jgi:hypothetical protein
MIYEFKLDQGGVVTVWDQVLDPYYADMEEGTEFTVHGHGFHLKLSSREWPKADPMKPKVMTRWSYKPVVRDGVRCWLVRKIPSVEAA